MAKKIALLLSGGFDSAAMMLILQKQGYKILPAFISFRKNEGGLTQKARKIAQSILQDAGIEAHLTVLRKLIPREKIEERNRIFLKTVTDLFPENIKRIAIGTYGPASQAWVQTYDLEDKALEYLQKVTPLKVLNFESLGLANREQVLRAIDKTDLTKKIMFQTTSCQIFGKIGFDCGRCHSCKARNAAFLKVWGVDKTGYKEGWHNSERVRRFKELRKKHGKQKIKEFQKLWEKWDELLLTMEDSEFQKAAKKVFKDMGGRKAVNSQWNLKTARGKNECIGEALAAGIKYLPLNPLLKELGRWDKGFQKEADDRFVELAWRPFEAYFLKKSISS